MGRRCSFLSGYPFLEVIKILHKVYFILLDCLSVQDSELRKSELGGKVVSFVLELELVRLPRFLQLSLIHSHCFLLDVLEGVRLIELDFDLECQVALAIENHEKVGFVCDFG